MRAGFPYRTYFGRLPTKAIKVVAQQPSTLITPTFTANRNNGVAPYGVLFDATATTAAAWTSTPFGDLDYEWDFGDTTGTYWAYGSKPGTQDKNKAYGPYAAHVFLTSGTKTVTLTVRFRDSGGSVDTATYTQNITVNNADTVFSGTNTICVANGTTPVPGVNGVPSGATCVNLSSFYTALNTYAASGKRILFKRGDTFTCATSYNLNVAGEGIIGAFGSGADPIITPSSAINAINFGNSGTNWRLMNLEFSGTDVALRPFNIGGSGSAQNGAYNLIQGCYIHNCYGTNSATTGVIWADSRIYNTMGTLGDGNNVLYLGGQEEFGFLGCSFDTCRGEHVTRIQGGRRFVFSNCDSVYPAENSRHAFALRGWSSSGVWTGVYSELAVISDNLIGGNSYAVTQFTSQNPSGTDERHRKIIFERNSVFSTSPSYSTTMMTQVQGEMTVRSNLFSLTGAGASQAVLITQYSPDVPDPSGHRVYNNSVYRGGTGAAAFMAHDNDTGTYLYNNLAYMPSASSPVLYSGTIAGASNNSSNAQILTPNPFTTSPPTTNAHWVPSGYPVNGGTYVVGNHRDFYANLITGTAEIGAIQV